MNITNEHALIKQKTKENDIERGREPDSTIRKRNEGYRGKHLPAIANRFLGNMREGPA